MKHNENETIWKNIELLSPDQILSLTEATLTFLQSHNPAYSNIKNMPKGPLIELMYKIAGETDAAVDKEAIGKIVSDKTLAVSLCKPLLAEIAKFPELATEIENIYTSKQRMMGIDPVSILVAGAIFVLAVKIKEMDFKNKKFTFSKLADKAVGTIVTMLQAMI